MLGPQIRKFRQLNSDERHALLTAAICLPIVGIALRLFGLRRVQAWCLSPGMMPRTPAPGPQEIHRLGEIVRIASRHTLGASTCLTRSILLCWMLRRRGVPGQLRIGVRLIDHALSAHAWVEYADAPINEQPDIASTYLPFDAPVSVAAFD